ncbi:MAG TPA: cysteine hydrolase [Allosphingosinicella sp.]|nr:cysteine hydrolase [Allosphingosinicella sp.]
MDRFVIVVDAQRDFMAAGGALSVPGADALIAPLRQWLADLDPGEIAGILFTFDTHEREAYAGSAEAAEFPLHCERGQPGWQLVADPDSVDPLIPRFRLEKGVFSMWAESDLVVRDMHGGAGRPRDAFFDDLKRNGIDTITVVGVAADYCVRWAIDGLVARGFRIEVPAALTRGIARQIDTVAAESWPATAVSLV